ncbi:hypothetical protein KC19_VG069000 [Ceratodon purpureus]|uniref:Uncharacterized protein n=1 Tax=Ceratodon purpureus TaxID=3225 RepID=A0A8T0HMQ5_CERPU|nr:hypothetical protein KC19_VG069000 [Ceratodon purpureus]
MVEMTSDFTTWLQRVTISWRASWASSYCGVALRWSLGWKVGREGARGTAQGGHKALHACRAVSILRATAASLSWYSHSFSASSVGGCAHIIEGIFLILTGKDDMLQRSGRRYCICYYVTALF